MDQKLLNMIALEAIDRHRAEVFGKFQDLLEEDFEKRHEQIPNMAVYHVHNAVLFDCLVWLNPLYSRENHSEDAWREYLSFAGTLEPKFTEIVNSLKDFRPCGQPQNKQKKDKVQD